ncbi:MAG: DUF898 family protein, partial [Casimicrobium sp.]
MTNESNPGQAVSSNAQASAVGSPGIVSPSPTAPPATANPAAQQDELPAQPFRFTGTGSEYFKIWIVNILLTIVTLG